jgi:hypothetical protein
MAAIPQVTPDGNYVASTEISVTYNESTEGVTVSPTWVNKNTTVRFKNPKGGKLRIVFLSPTGKDCETVLDSELCKLTVGGTYHFKCFFTLPGTNNEIGPKSGGVIDVTPTRP